MLKKSQVSLFILIGLVMLIGYSFVAYINNQKAVATLEGAGLNPDAANIKDFVELCLKQTAIDGLIFVGSKGGYYEDPPRSIDYFFRQVPYYFYLSQNVSPTQDFVALSISKYIEENLDFCANDFIDYQGIKVEAGRINANTQFTKGKVILTLNYPITVQRGNSATQLEVFRTELPIRYLDLYATGLKITELQMKDNDNICLSCLVDAAAEHNVRIKFENYDENTILFTVTLNTTSVDSKIIDLIFANRYR